MKDYLPAREYSLYRKYFYLYGIGQEAEYTRSANQIITIANYITGAMGGKPKKLSVTDIYPQLDYNNKKKHGKYAVDWDKTPEHLRKELIDAGIYSEEGEPLRSVNPHF